MVYKYRHYIFDLDGTLADTSEGIYDAYRFTFEQMGQPITESSKLDEVIGDPLFDNFTKRFGLSEEDAHMAISIYRERYAQVGVREAQIYPGIKELFSHLKSSGYRISVATLKRTDLARSILRRQELLPYIDKVCGIDSGDSLTKTELIRMCMQSSYCLPWQTIVIGDSVIDFESAKECGASFLGAGYGLGDIRKSEVADCPNQGYWGIVDNSNGLKDRLNEILDTDITPPSVFQDGPVKVSVVVITYNHAKYIQECLNSILLQRTNFRFEVLIGDDASPDDTQDILRDYLEKYPEIFHMELRPENVGATKNVYDLFKKAKGQYIATLEGDDYWSDVDKLQIQYDFLEDNPTYIACTHRTIWVSENRIPLPSQPDLMHGGGIFTLKDLDGYHLPGDVLSQFFRNYFQNNNRNWSIQETAHPLIGDTTTWLLTLLQGDCFCIERVMGHHRRRVQKNATNAVSILYNNSNIYFEWFIYYCKLENYAKEEFGRDVYFSRKEFQFENEIQNCIKDPLPRRKANIKKMIALSKRPGKYRLILLRKYFHLALRFPKYVFKKVRNKYHSLLLEKLEKNLQQMSGMAQRQSRMEQQLQRTEMQMKAVGKQLNTVAEQLELLLDISKNNEE